MIDRSRRGRFFINDRLLEDEPEVVRKFLASMIVVRCEHLWQDRQFEYQAVGSVFAAVPDGQMTPDYRLIYDHAKGELLMQKCEFPHENFRSMEHINVVDPSTFV